MKPSDDQFKVGLFGIGLDAYWPQFPGLRMKLLRSSQQVARRLEGFKVQVTNLGLIDSPEKSFWAGHEFRKADVDLIFLYVTTYALSSTVLPAVRRAKVPVIILNLSPGPAIDYERFNRLGDRTKMTESGSHTARLVRCPRSRMFFSRCRIPFFQVTGMLENDPIAWNEIDEWIDAARVVHVMEHNRLGVMGNYYGGMLDIYSDLTQQCAYFGGHIEILEVEELSAMRREVNEADVEPKSLQNSRLATCKRMRRKTNSIARRARPLLLIGLSNVHKLGSLAYYHKGIGSPENEDAISSIILGTSLLTGRGFQSRANTKSRTLRR